MKIEDMLESTSNDGKQVVSARIDSGIVSQFKELQDRSLKNGYKLRLATVIEEALKEMIVQGK